MDGEFNGGLWPEEGQPANLAEVSPFTASVRTSCCLGRHEGTDGITRKEQYTPAAAQRPGRPAFSIGPLTIAARIERSQMVPRQSNSRGSALPMVVLAACATAVMPVVAFMKPEYTYPCMFFFLIGLTGTWRQYVRWRRTKRELPGQTGPA